jgi:hypothetical protein
VLLLLLPPYHSTGCCATAATMALAELAGDVAVLGRRLAWRSARECVAAARAGHARGALAATSPEAQLTSGAALRARQRDGPLGGLNFVVKDSMAAASRREIAA